MPYSLSNWTPAFIRHGWNHEPPVHETESTFWKHAKQVLKGGSLLMAGVLGYLLVQQDRSNYRTNDDTANVLQTYENKRSVAIQDPSWQLNLDNIREERLIEPLQTTKSLTFNSNRELDISYRPKAEQQRKREKEEQANQLNTSFGQKFRDLTRKNIGDEFLINSITVNNATSAEPAVINLDNGNFVVTWAVGVINDSGIRGQLFNAAADIISNIFTINNYTVGIQAKSAVASLPTGNFVVTWQSDGQDGSGFGIYGQLFGSAANKIGSEFSINNGKINNQTDSVVTSLSNGNFIVAWTTGPGGMSDGGIRGQLFNAAANKISNEFSVNNYTLGAQSMPAIASLSAGNFVVTWQSDGQDGSGLGVYGQLFNAAANKIGNEFSINNYTAGTQARSAVTSLSNGNFAVTWQSDGQDGSGQGIYGQLFNATADKVGNEFPVNTYTTGNQTMSAITNLFSGNFVVTWTSDRPDNSGSRIYGQLFNATAGKIGSEFPVSSYKVGLQRMPAVASLFNGNFVVTWDSKELDGSGDGIYGKIIDTHLYAINVNQTIIYTENTSYKLTAITIKPAIFIDTFSASLQLSNSSAGRLTTGISNNVTSLFNVNQGLWQAAGAVNDVNNLLANLTFQPTQYFNGNFTIKVTVNDGFNTPLNDTIAVQGIAVNQLPVVENNQLTIEQGQKVILNRSNLSATDVDSDNAALIFSVSNVRHGQFEFIDDPDTAINSFTQ